MVLITISDQFLMREWGIYKGMNFVVIKRTEYHPHPRKNPSEVVFYYHIKTTITGDNNHKGQAVEIRITDKDCIEIQGPLIP